MVDLDDLKTFMRITTADQDEILEEALAAANDYVREKTGIVMTAAPDAPPTNVRVYASGRALVLPYIRLDQDAILTVTDPHGNTVELADCDVNGRSGIITVPRVKGGSWTVSLNLPKASESLELAVKIIAEHLFGIQRGTGGVGPRQAAYGRQEGDRPAIGFAIPHRAKQLIEPYVVPGIG
ncbi:phage head-tail connector protein [Pseudactinotalea suaedae]|uniref:phage head-tail connector protein n=1 Tax=Pseudactinotalea suaedae TaxID=1524924 RepID=UPI0012E0F668|nr:phage head-tail connector protein [Pseudactinotalea suaedae]